MGERDGIKLHTTVPYYAAPNSVVLRTKALTNAMLMQLPTRACSAEAFNTTTDRTPTKALDIMDRTCLLQVMYDMKPGLTDSCVFGALCTIFGPSEKLKKP